MSVYYLVIGAVALAMVISVCLALLVGKFIHSVSEKEEEALREYRRGLK